MANGDAAAAKGLHIVAPTDDHSVGYDDINIRGDELAAEIDARIAGDALAFPSAKIIVASSEPAYVAGAIWLKPLS